MSQPYSLIITPPIDPVNAAYTQAVDLSAFIDPNQGKGLDPVDPKFTDKIFAHSLLKQGGTLALEDLALKELVFPLWLQAANPSAGAALVTKINNAINAPGAVVTWQDFGVSQPTYFDLASGQLDIEYDFRRAQGGQYVLAAKLRLFSQPLGRQAAAAPLLATGGATVLAGTGPLIKFVAGATLPGDAPALLDAAVFGASGPVSNGDGNFTIMSVLPDALFAPQLTLTYGSPYFTGSASDAVGGTYVGATNGTVGGLVAANPIAAAVTAGMTVAPPRYARRLRLIGLGRSIGATGSIAIYSHGYAGGQYNVWHPVPVGDWSPVDCGTVSLAPGQQVTALQLAMGLFSATPTQAVQLTAMYCLPDDTTCVLNPSLAALVDYQFAVSPNIEFDGTFNYGAGACLDTGQGADVSSAVRGAIPAADPKNGPPALAFLSIPQGSPTANPQNLPWSVQVKALPRTRFIFQ